MKYLMKLQCMLVTVELTRRIVTEIFGDSVNEVSNDITEKFMEKL